MPTVRCPYCHSLFEPSRFRPGQTVCSSPDCQRRRRAEYHRRKIASDPVYAQAVKDSQIGWRQEHPGYQKTYWQSHPEAAERNRSRQRDRDRRRRRTAVLVKNNLALDLKHAGAEIWLVRSEAAADLVKNNAAFSEVLVFQQLASPPPPSCKEHPSGFSAPLPV